MELVLYGLELVQVGLLLQVVPCARQFRSHNLHPQNCPAVPLLNRHLMGTSDVLLAAGLIHDSIPHH